MSNDICEYILVGNRGAIEPDKSTDTDLSLSIGFSFSGKTVVLRRGIEQKTSTKIMFECKFLLVENFE